MPEKRRAIGGGPPPITLFTFILEVGRLLPVPPTRTLSYDARTSAWDGWTPLMLSQILDREEPPSFSDNMIPGFRIEFRDVAKLIGMKLQAPEIAFADWLEPIIGTEGLDSRAAMREQYGTTLEVRESVVALTRFIPESEHPASEDLTVRWLTEIFRGLLAELNRVLDHLSFVAHDWALAGIERRDLPPLLPVLLQSTHADSDRNVRGTPLLIPLHDDFPYPEEAGPPDFDSDAIETALAIVNSHNHDDQPFEPAFRFLRAATSERVGGDSTRAVVDLATAMELLFSQIIATGGASAGWDQARIERANNEKTQLRGRVVDHLAPLLGATLDLTDRATPWGIWWSEGYARRNRAVHNGERLTDRDAAEAWAAADALLTELVARLRAQAALKTVADQLSVISLGADPPWLDQSLPADIDWF